MRLSSFLPRTRSRIVFVVLIACYGKTSSGLLRAVANTFGAERQALASISNTVIRILSAAGHVPLSAAVVVLPAWFIMGWAYLYWRPESWKTGFVVIASIHALLNFNGAIWTISYAIHYQEG